jgi:hypothetical protein
MERDGDDGSVIFCLTWNLFHSGGNVVYDWNSRSS